LVIIFIKAGRINMEFSKASSDEEPEIKHLST
jgi:hypothetical protein